MPEFSRSEASYSVRLSLFMRSMDESDILDDARLYDELHVDDGWAADSDSADSGEEELHEAEASDEGEDDEDEDFFLVET